MERRERGVGVARATAAILLLAGLGFLASVATIPAGDFRILDPDGLDPNGKQRPGKAPHEDAPFTHWDLREMPDCRVPWMWGLSFLTPDLDSNGVADEDADENLAIATAQAAFDRWDEVTPSKLNFEFASSNGFSSQHGFKVDQWNTITFSPNGLPRTTFGGTVVVRDKDTGRILEADILINSSPDSIPGRGFRKWVIQNHGDTLTEDIDSFPRGNWPNAADGDKDWNHDHRQEYQGDLGKTMTHEIGHFIGLAHFFPLKGASNDFHNPIMEEFTKTIGPKLGGWTNLTLKDPDRDGENFLYCPDLGDAPDPWMGVDGLYPSNVHLPFAGRTLNGIPLDGIAPGAEHILGIKARQPTRNWTYEWLAESDGGNVNSECEANIVDKDGYDDGVTWAPDPPVWGRTMTVWEWARYASDNVGNAHLYFINPLYTNAWMDINQNCVWEEGVEHFLHDSVVDFAPTGNNNVKVKDKSGDIELPLIVDPKKAVWLRCRLDYGENSAPTGIDGTLNLPAGAAQFGEVEDYPFYCTSRYETIYFCNPLPFAIPAVAMVIVGAPDPSDEAWSALVTANDCPTLVNPAPLTTYVPASDETVVEFPVPGWLPPHTYGHFARCRPNEPPKPPQTDIRMMCVTPGVPSTTPPGLVPAELRIPTVNCAYHVYEVGGPNVGKVKFTVGAVNFENGGWIDGPEALTHAWDDTLRVTVSYRVAPSVIPIQNLNLCDPLYSTLLLHPVGPGNVTPEHAFEFLLDLPTDVPVGSHVILEVQSRWSTNATVSNQIIEFPDAIGAPTGLHDSPPPRQLALENYPNPFNPTTTIRFALPKPAIVTLAVFDVSGRHVRTLLRNASKPVGVFEVEWDGTDGSGRPVASGVYFYRLTAGSETLTRKAVLLK